MSTERAHEDQRAERAILSHAEAYRLVEETRQMRAERDEWQWQYNGEASRSEHGRELAEQLTKLVAQYGSDDDLTAREAEILAVLVDALAIYTVHYRLAGGHRSRSQGRRNAGGERMM